MNPLRIPRILSALMAALLTAPAGGQVPRAKFAPAVSYDPGPGSMSVAVADLRSNGKLDLVVANYCKSYNQSGNCIDNAEGGVGVLMGNGDGTYQPAVAYGTGAPLPLRLLLEMSMATACPTSSWPTLGRPIMRRGSPSWEV